MKPSEGTGGGVVCLVVFCTEPCRCGCKLMVEEREKEEEQEQEGEKDEGEKDEEEITHTVCSFAREHDAVGPVNDSIKHVSGLQQGNIKSAAD